MGLLIGALAAGALLALLWLTWRKPGDAEKHPAARSRAPPPIGFSGMTPCTRAILRAGEKQEEGRK